MTKDQKQDCYSPLQPHYINLSRTLPIERFAKVEAMLFVLTQCAPDADPAKAYLLLTQYQLIGTRNTTREDHLLQTCRTALMGYRSKKYWTDDWKEYCKEIYKPVRVFDLIPDKEGKTKIVPNKSNAIPYSYQMRTAEWKILLETVPAKQRLQTAAERGSYHYFADGGNEKIQIKFENGRFPASNAPAAQKAASPRDPICISTEELLTCAKMMQKIDPGDPCYQILSTNRIRKVDGADILGGKPLTIERITNVAGMVGSGKSTLLKVLAFWCSHNQKRMMIVLDTVTEVVRLWKYLRNLQVQCSPVVGRQHRLKYLDQLHNDEDSMLTPELSHYLTPACLLDGMDEAHDLAISFGTEPCSSLYKGKQRVLCPYFDHCPGTAMMRECYDSKVVLTTVAGFAASRVGRSRETLAALALREFDLVVFDECDRVQKALDNLLMPETSFNKYVQESAPECEQCLRKTNEARLHDPARRRYDELQLQASTVMGRISDALQYNLGSWNKLDHGDTFSALTLLNDLYKKETLYQIPEKVYWQLYDLMETDQNDARKNTLWLAMQVSCKDSSAEEFDILYDQWLKEKPFDRPEKTKDQHVQDNRIKLILCLIYFDHFIRELSDAYRASHELGYGQNELFDFLQNRFLEQQQILPSALCGNLFGMKLTDGRDICLYRQYAFGRSLMKDLPYLCTAEDGTPMGPHVLLLSGSSWAEGSYEYHVNRPVNYILESDAEKRAFLKCTKFRESGLLTRVSGTAQQEKEQQLRKIIEESTESIIEEWNRNAGKILLVVNSYAQAEVVHQALKRELNRRNCPARVCRLCADTNTETEIPSDEILRRGEVSRFAMIPQEILVAPALAIERGHNIVDENGHTALGAVFFLVRPMSVPDDIQQEGGKLNGYIEANCRRGETETAFDYNARVRREAVTRWNRFCGKTSPGLSDLPADERRDIVATLFILILQIFGRLARITDTTRPEPHVWFIDGAFRAKPDRPNDFDCLNELGAYLEQLMTAPESAQIAQTLYGPFYEAYKGGIACGK